VGDDEARYPDVPSLIRGVVRNILETPDAGPQ
jgi:hypothetical protein